MTGDDLRRRRLEEARRAGDQARDEARWADAAEAYRAYLGERPHDAAIWIQLGHMRTESGDFHGADRAYRTAWRLEPEDADLLLCWGHSRRRADDLAAARDLYARSYRIDGGADALKGLQDSGGRVQDAEPVRSFRVVGRIDRTMGREVAGHVRAPVRHDAYVEFRSAGEVVGRAELDGVLRQGRYLFETTLELEDDAVVDAFLMPDEDGFDASPFRAVLGPPDPPASAARDARVEIVRWPELDGGMTAILAATSTTGALRANVEPYVRALKAQGIAVVLVVSTDRPMSLPSRLPTLADCLVVREGSGFGLDMAGWAQALSLFPQLYSASRLLLLNDHMAGPAEGEALARLLERVRASPADFVALTETHDPDWLPERYFLALSRSLLSSPALQRLFETAPIHLGSQQAAQDLHRALVQAVDRSGRKSEVLFSGVHPTDPLRWSWRRLAKAGLPFAAPRPFEEDAAAQQAWRTELKTAGFDLDELDELRRSDELQSSARPGDDRLLAYRLPEEAVCLRPLRLALVCDWTAGDAQGAIWRTLIAALRAGGCELALHPLAGAGRGPGPIAMAVPQLDFHGPADVAILQLGPKMAGRFTQGQVRLSAAARRRIGTWFEPPPPGDKAIPTPRGFDVHRVWTLTAQAAAVSARSDAPVDAWRLIEAGTAGEPESDLRRLGRTLDHGLRAVLERRTMPGLPYIRPFAADLRRGLTLDDAALANEMEVLVLEPDGAPVDGSRHREIAARLGGSRWVMLAPRGAVLAPDVAAVLRAQVRARPEVAIFYADDLAMETPQAVDQLRLKPEFDATLLAAQDYVGAPVMIRGSAFVELGGLDSRRGTAAVADLLFRAHAAGLGLARIPEVLLAYPGARVRARDQDYRAMLAAQASLSDYDIQPGHTASTFALHRRFEEAGAPEVTLIVPTCRSVDPQGEAYVARLLDRLAGTAWPMHRLQVLVGDDVGGDEPPWARVQRTFALRRIETPRVPGEPFNYAAKMNRLWREARTEQVVFLNDDVAPVNDGWLAALQTFAVTPDVGGVGARLLFEDGSLQHAGVVPHGLGGAHAWVFRRRVEGTYQDWSQVHREWSMVTGAVFATRRSVLERMGGFDERFSLEFNDSDLCLRLRAFGYRIVYTPHAELVHVEKASRGEAEPPGGDRALFRSRWSAWLEADPFWHPGLRRDLIEVAPARPAEGSWFL